MLLPSSGTLRIKRFGHQIIKSLLEQENMLLPSSGTLKRVLIIWCPNLLTLSVPDEGYNILSCSQRVLIIWRPIFLTFNVPDEGYDILSCSQRLFIIWCPNLLTLRVQNSFGTRKYVIALIRYTQSQKIWTPNN
jgi:hypothetical protein